MNQDVKQCWASFPMEQHFAEGLREKWNLTKYYDPYSPTVMFGWYDDKDIEFIKNHKSSIIMLWGGADMNPFRINYIKNRKDTYQIGYGWQKILFEKCNAPYKDLNIPYKSYDRFKPTILGENIYVYRGWKVPRNDYFSWNTFIKPLFGVFGEDRFTFGMGYDIDYIHENFYKDCFVYLKPNERGGSTSMYELAHMGRKTIAQNQGGLPNVLEYRDIHHVIELIQQEAEKIGTIQEQVALDIKNHMDDDYRWLNLDYHKNDING